MTFSYSNKHMPSPLFASHFPVISGPKQCKSCREDANVSNIPASKLSPLMPVLALTLKVDLTERVPKSMTAST